MSEEADLEVSAKTVGQILPVIVNQKGVVVDGRHRLRADKNWKKEVVELDDLRTNVARLVVNATRRVVTDADYKELYDYLEDCCKNNIPVMHDGEDISNLPIREQMHKLTEIPQSTINKHIYNLSIPDNTRAYVPKQVAEPIQELSYLTRNLPAEKAAEVIEKVKKTIEKESDRITEKKPELAESYRKYARTTKKAVKERKKSARKPIRQILSKIHEDKLSSELAPHMRELMQVTRKAIVDHPEDAHEIVTTAKRQLKISTSQLKPRPIPVKNPDVDHAALTRMLLLRSLMKGLQNLADFSEPPATLIISQVKQYDPRSKDDFCTAARIVIRIGHKLEKVLEAL